MSANDYLASLTASNPNLLLSANRISISSQEFKRQITLAFEAGKTTGIRQAEAAKSMFEKVFGK